MTALRIFLNVGGRKGAPGGCPIDVRCRLPRQRLGDGTLDAVPEHLVVVGGSYIGPEVRVQVTRRPVRRQTVVAAWRLPPREDEDRSDGIRAILGGRGRALEPGASAPSLMRAYDQVLSARPAAEARASSAAVLLAVGRQSNTGDLWPGRGRHPHRRARLHRGRSLKCRTSAEGVCWWATATAAARSRTRRGTTTRSSSRTCSTPIRAASPTVSRYAPFIDPALGRVGTTEAEARAGGRRRKLRAKMPIAVGQCARGRRDAGFAKLRADADSGLILGAAILGPNGDEVAIRCST